MYKSADTTLPLSPNAAQFDTKGKIPSYLSGVLSLSLMFLIMKLVKS